MNYKKISVICCMGIWGYVGAMEVAGTAATQVQSQGKAVAAKVLQEEHLTAAQSADQKFWRDKFSPSLAKQTFEIRDIDDERLVKMYFCLGLFDYIEKPSMCKSYSVAHLKASMTASMESCNNELQDLGAKLQQGKLLVMLDTMKLSDLKAAVETKKE
jgi:hypothetical protein